MAQPRIRVSTSQWISLLNLGFIDEYLDEVEETNKSSTYYVTSNDPLALAKRLERAASQCMHTPSNIQPSGVAYNIRCLREVAAKLNNTSL